MTHDCIDVDAFKTKLRQFDEERDWMQFHNPKNLVMNAANEMGELLELFQWLTQEQAEKAFEDDALKHNIGFEIADIMTALIRLADKCDIHISKALDEKLMQNATKYPPEKARGSCQKYTTYLEN